MVGRIRVGRQSLWAVAAMLVTVFCYIAPVFGQQIDPRGLAQLRY